MCGVARVLRQPMSHPLIRGMVAYSVIWPAGSVIQEYMAGKSLEDTDWPRAARFSVFGGLFMSPVLYAWMRYSGRFFKRKSLATCIKRAAIEQVVYTPLALSYFFFGMSLLEQKSIDACVNEVKQKFWQTYKLGVVYWPTVQTLNFYFIGEKNRVVFVSAASFVWTLFLSHVKSLRQNTEDITEKRPS